MAMYRQRQALDPILERQRHGGKKAKVSKDAPPGVLGVRGTRGEPGSETTDLPARSPRRSISRPRAEL